MLRVLQLLLEIATKVDTINACKTQNPDNPKSMQAAGLVLNELMSVNDVLLYCGCVFLFSP